MIERMIERNLYWCHFNVFNVSLLWCITFGSLLTWASRIWHFQNTWSPASTKTHYSGCVCRDEGTGNDIQVCDPLSETFYHINSTGYKNGENNHVNDNTASHLSSWS